MKSDATAVGQDGEDDPQAEEIFAVVYRVITRELMGLGNRTRLLRTAPDYHGGQSFGESSNDSDDTDEEDEFDIDSEIRDLNLSTDDISPATIGVVTGNPAFLSDDGGFVYFP